MIKTKRGNTKFDGTGHELCIDFITITKALYEVMQKEGLEKEEAKNLLTTSFELGFKTEEELEQEAKEIVVKILKGVVDEFEREDEKHE